MNRRLILAGLDTEDRAEIALALADKPTADHTDLLAAILAVLMRSHRESTT